MSCPSAGTYSRSPVQFTLCWNENGQLIRHLVRDLDELIALLPRLLTARPETGLSGAQLLLQTVSAGAYSHLIYVSGEQPAGRTCKPSVISRPSSAARITVKPII